MFVANKESSTLNRYFYIAICLTALLGAFSCAKIGTPYGGPKDETPPRVIKTKPPANTVNFEPQKKIVISFDEYIQIENIFDEMIISPPVEGRISAQVKGKDLVVTFPSDTIFDSTTYTLDFGNAISDYNEGNMLKNYRYVFSLKNYIDSMNVDGKIVNAFNHQPDKDRMNVMLYRNLNDSAPYLEKPAYICRTDEQGNYSINNIETGHYRLFALKDANSNMLYDQPNENIAFYDSIIELTTERFQNNIIVNDTLFTNDTLVSDSIPLSNNFLNTDSLTPDTITKLTLELYQDSIHVSDTLLTHVNVVPDSIDYCKGIFETDSLVSDSIMTDSLKENELYYSFYTELFFFTEEIKNQYMTNHLRPLQQQLLFTFNETPADTFEFFPLNYTPRDPDWFLLDANPSMDTLKFWITDTSMISMDTLQIEACYPMYDSLGIMYQHVDTFMMKREAEQERSGRIRRSRSHQSSEENVEEKVAPKIVLQNNIRNTGAFDLNKNIIFISKTPLSRVLTDSIRLFRIQDTLEIPVKIETVIDTNSLYKVYIRYKPEGITLYKVFMPDSIFFDIYGATNDTLIFSYKTQSDDYYGALTINLQEVDTPLVLQLLNDKEELLSERKILTNESIRFDYLDPKKYFLKIIVDTNGNGKWDTGNYLKHIQPEKVIYYPQVIDIRSNWEMDFIWDISANE